MEFLRLHLAQKSVSREIPSCDIPQHTSRRNSCKFQNILATLKNNSESKHIGFKYYKIGK